MKSIGKMFEENDARWMMLGTDEGSPVGRKYGANELDESIEAVKPYDNRVLFSIYAGSTVILQIQKYLDTLEIV